MRKFIVFILVTTIVAGVTWRLYIATAMKSSGMVRGKSPIAVETVQVTIGDIQDISEFTGTLAGKAEVTVLPKISGIVKAIHVDLGDEFSAGRLLIEIDDEETKHAVEEARARLAVAKASLEENNTNLATAMRELERVKTLHERKVAAISELDAAESNVQTLTARKKYAEAFIEQQIAAIQAAEARLNYTKIVAPISGYVGKRFLDEGALVSPSTPILQLVDISTVKTVIGVVERDYSKITTGLKASLSVDAYPNRVFDGTVTRIAPVLDPNTRTAETEIEFQNPDLRLKPGMFARVHILFGVRDNAILIPNKAIVKRDRLTGVFVPDETRQTAKFIDLDLGLSNDQYTEVHGLEPDQEIIIMGQHLLNDNDPIVFANTNRQSKDISG